MGSFVFMVSNAENNSKKINKKINEVMKYKSWLYGVEQKEKWNCEQTFTVYFSLQQRKHEFIKGI